MYGDYSRVRFVPTAESRANPYSAVWAQQGRLLLDAELNEQTAIVLEYLRTLTVDFIGPFGGHIHRAGFKVVHERERFAFTHGHYYVHGLRCVADHTPELDLPEPPFIIYLLVWEQTIGPIQDPALADPALGPDAANTTRRTKVTWRLHATPRLHGSQRRLSGEESVEEIIGGFARQNAEPRDRPLLRAGTAPGGEGSAAEPDTAPVAVPYRGVENQLYRVEVHTGGRADRATFKWSRDNGSVEFAIESLEGPDAHGELTARLKRLWIDARSGLEPGDWVELLDDDWMPAGEPTPLLQVKTVRPSAREVVLTPGSGTYEFDAGRHPFLRRWDHSQSRRGQHDPDHGGARGNRRLDRLGGRRENPVPRDRSRVSAGRLLADPRPRGDRRCALADLGASAARARPRRPGPIPRPARAHHPTRRGGGDPHNRSQNLVHTSRLARGRARQGGLTQCSVASNEHGLRFSIDSRLRPRTASHR